MKRCKWRLVMCLAWAVTVLSGCNPAMDEVSPGRFAFEQAQGAIDTPARPADICRHSSGHRSD